MGKRVGIWWFLLLVLVFSILSCGLVYGVDNGAKHMKLLAVQESGEEYKGSIADLGLELKEGSGRVFLETFPLTKMDTQISTRFAKEMACDYFDLDCSNYDFIYTIKANSNIIGGPSAGAAIAALTAMAVLDLDYDEKITITGTINSGGTIGPVGGVKEKLEAAAQNGIGKVLVAKGGGVFTGENKTIDLMEYGQKNLSLGVGEVGDLNELVFEMTGKRLKDNGVELEESEDYQEIMKELSRLLCERMEELENNLKGLELDEEDILGIEGKKNSSKVSLESGDYYSGASFCFGANIMIRNLEYNKKEVGIGWLEKKIEELKRKVELMGEKLEKEKIKTISDLQAMMIVKERLDEVKELIAGFEEEENKRYTLAYAEERFFSAVSWTYFFKMEGKEFVLNKERLKESCMKKIAEGEERYQYVELIFGLLPVGHIKEKIGGASKDLEEGEYDLCLIKAAQAKAEANAILSSMGLNEDNFGSFLESKFGVVEKIIAENSMEGVFPILGYSYYQYATSLKEMEKHSALLYLEYALEMSDLDIYFEEEKEGLVFGLGGKGVMWLKWSEEWVLLGEGFILGFLVALLFVFGGRMLKEKKKPLNKKYLKNIKK